MHARRVYKVNTGHAAVREYYRRPIVNVWVAFKYLGLVDERWLESNIILIFIMCKQM